MLGVTAVDVGSRTVQLRWEIGLWAVENSLAGRSAPEPDKMWWESSQVSEVFLNQRVCVVFAENIS